MLTSKQRQIFKAMAHGLKPVVMIGVNGLTENVIEEINQALLCHELIKIKISGCEKDERNEVANTITNKLHAELIQKIGHIIVIYRKNPKK